MGGHETCSKTEVGYILKKEHCIPLHIFIGASSNNTHDWADVHAEKEKIPRHTRLHAQRI